MFSHVTPPSHFCLGDTCPFQRCSCLQIIIWNIKCLGDLVSEVSGIGFAWCLFVWTIENSWKFILDTNMLKIWGPHNYYPSKIMKLRLRIAEKKTLNDVDIEWSHFTSNNWIKSPQKRLSPPFLSWKTCSSCNCTACRSSAKRNSCAKTVSWKPANGLGLATPSGGMKWLRLIPTKRKSQSVIHA